MASYESVIGILEAELTAVTPNGQVAHGPDRL